MGTVTVRLIQEDECDLKYYQQALKEYQNDPETISHADFKKKVGISI